VKRVGWTACVAALCAVVAILWWRFGSERAQSGNSVPIQSPRAIATSVDTRVVTPASVPPSQDSSPPGQVADYAAQLRAASDYLEFTNSLIAAARRAITRRSSIFSARSTAAPSTIAFTSIEGALAGLSMTR
jgi:hypothetical protein